LHESLPIYSGGLGVLAGDHIKSASDLDIPLVGVGLFYGQGYFRQRLDMHGWQQEEYSVTDVNPAADGSRPSARAANRSRCRSRRAAESIQAPRSGA
jgi:glucan phosphorylase